MAYDGEFAGYQPIHRLVQSQRVNDLLRKYRPRIEEEEKDVSDMILYALPTDRQTVDVNTLIAVDGSHHEVEVDNGYPGAEASYVTVASVMLDLNRIRELDDRRPVKPQEFFTTQNTGSVDSAFPGRNVIYEGDPSARESLRRAMYDVFASSSVMDVGESLLETYEALLANKPQAVVPQKCPYGRECMQDPPAPFLGGAGVHSCGCTATKPCYSTDALRIHEGFLDTSANGAVFGEVMQVLERLTLINVLRTLEQKDLLATTSRLAFVLDGPLAVFGHPAWLSQSISSELKRINEQVRRLTGKDLLIIGIEKSGMFVEHFGRLDRGRDNRRDAFPRRHALLLSDKYIKHHVVPSDSLKPYGLDTYFGRKLLYKTATGTRVVATLPFLAEDHHDMRRATPDQFPRLDDALILLDSLVSAMHPGALSPLVAAHAEAAIPLHLGQKVLDRLAKSLMSIPT